MKQTVKILDTYKVEIDKWNHTLYQYDAGGDVITVGKNRGNLTKPRWVEMGFYPNLKQCLNRILLEESITGDSQTIESYLDCLESIVDRLEEAV